MYYVVIESGVQNNIWLFYVSVNEKMLHMKVKNESD